MNINIKRSTNSFFFGTLISRVTGFLRDICMAFTFGVDVNIAIFLLAFRLAHLLRRIFGEGPLHSAFIPKYQELKLKCESLAENFFTTLRSYIIKISFRFHVR